MMAGPGRVRGLHWMLLRYDYSFFFFLVITASFGLTLKRQLRKLIIMKRNAMGFSPNKRTFANIRIIWLDFGVKMKICLFYEMLEMHTKSFAIQRLTCTQIGRIFQFVCMCEKNLKMTFCSCWLGNYCQKFSQIKTLQQTYFLIRKFLEIIDS